jgi:hypothetical protein
MIKEDIRKEFGEDKIIALKSDGVHPTYIEYYNEKYIDFLENKIIELDKQIIREI